MLSTFTNHFTAFSSTPNRAIALSTDKSHIMIACESFMFFLCVSPWGGLWIIPVFGIRWQLCSYLPFMCKYNTPERERQLFSYCFPRASNTPKGMYTSTTIIENHVIWASHVTMVTHVTSPRCLAVQLILSRDMLAYNSGVCHLPRVVADIHHCNQSDWSI